MKFSIIIPVFNVEKYLSQCVDSVLVQDFSDYEIILVNDGSTDNSGKICDEYSQKYSHIKVIHKQNGGLSDARNFGIKQAEGDYLMFLDSDDFWFGNKVLSEINFLIEKNNKPDLILYGMTQFFDGQEVDKLDKLDKFPSFNKLSNDFQNDFEYLVNNCLYKATGCDKVIKRNIIIENYFYFPKGKLHEDVAWCYDIINSIKTYLVYPNSFYCYRRSRSGSITYKLTEKSVMDIIDMVSDRADNQESKKVRNQFLFLWGYIIIIIIITNILSKENYKNYFPKVKKTSFLLKYAPSSLSKKQKIKLFIYKILGIKIAGKLEFYLRKLLKKL